MIQGAKKISELTSTTLNGSEIIPVVQDDGLGNLTTFKVLASSLGTDTNFANTDLTLTANRSHNFDGFDMTFTDAKLLVYGSAAQTIYANNSGSGSSVVGVANTGTAVNGSSTSGNGVSGSSTNSNGVTGESANSKGGAFRNQVLVEEYSTANEVQEASSLFEVKSTVKGALLPRMTTTQKNAISTPATGLIVFDTTLNRYEFYNGSDWVAYYTDPDGWTTIVKSANQDVTNNATLQDDTELQFSVVAGGHYMIKCDLTVSGFSTTADYKFAFNVSSGTMTGKGHSQSINATGAIQNLIVSANSASTASLVVGASAASLDDLTAVSVAFSFTASANASFRFQFANNTATPGAASRTWKGSILKYKRID